MKDFSCFKAYDIRGELGVNIDPEICYDIGRAFAISLNAKRVVVGFDARKHRLPCAMRCRVVLWIKGLKS